ncbi:hypothetical protein B1759_17330 [Rubrivirga sp. SAORIC476]|uniref:hypothetical protein n=1 Tax=Rubrivirga sp. SAORIC476 TaxID=1961794 RepID=UPI000BA9804B|nr:hypothetical protein [Rubrivirga sp. SAORIC476]MAQ95311.1 hypothetical protein [Rhodothermaceae bacterium]MBC13387.1 hypothetical protein [Rhodothermaceae bacterium]PAP74709.1 hypothetical protein B1759_17330 [Rubrivirga sp. SAORIC476]
MCDLKHVNPPDNAFPTGSSIDAKCEVRISDDDIKVGSGHVTDYTSDHFAGSGSYDYHAGSGDWTVTLDKASDDWSVDVKVTGSQASHNTFEASCSGAGSTITFKKKGDASTTIEVEQESDSIRLKPSWTAISFYLRQGS